MKQASVDRPERRSDATRGRILKAAREAFATLGYEGATVRGIAESANIHPSMVMRYFSSKEGLFTASCAFDLRLPDLSAIPAQKIGDALVRHFLERWEGSQAADDLPALLRIAVTHPEGREKTIAIFTEQVEPAIRKFARSGNPGLSAALIATQLVGLAFLRYVVHLPALIAIDRQTLIKQVGQTVQRYLEGTSGRSSFMERRKA